MKLQRLFPVFGTAFALIYAPVLYYNWALVTYHPAINTWELGAVAPKAGPPMYWYGLLATSVIGAVIVTAIVALLPQAITRWFWPGLTWLVPVAVLAFVVYILRPYFLS